MVITLFKAQTTKNIKEKKRLSKCDELILIEHSCTLNNNNKVILKWQ